MEFNPLDIEKKIAASGGPNIPEGVHKIEILDCCEGVSKKSQDGKPNMLIITKAKITVESGGEQITYEMQKLTKDGTQKLDNSGNPEGVLYISTSSAFFFKKAVVALGLLDQYAEGKITPKDIIGKTGLVMCEIEERTFNGETKSFSRLGNLVAENENQEEVVAAYHKRKAEQKKKAQEELELLLSLSAPAEPTTGMKLDDDIPF